MSTNISGTNGIDQIQAGAVQFDDVSAGMVIQVANYTTGAMATGPTTTPVDNTIPQINEGNQFLSLAFTAKKATSKLKIEVVCNTAANAATGITTALFKDSITDAIGVIYDGSGIANSMTPKGFTVYINAIDISPHTFTVRVGGAAASIITFNGMAGVAYYNGMVASSITITEIAQ